MASRSIVEHLDALEDVCWLLPAHSWPSLAAQSLDRIDPRRPPSRYQIGQERDREQKQRNRRERHRILRSHLEEKGLQGLAEPPPQRQADAEADRRLGGRRASRQAMLAAARGGGGRQILSRLRM